MSGLKRIRRCEGRRWGVLAAALGVGCGHSSAPTTAAPTDAGLGDAASVEATTGDATATTGVAALTSLGAAPLALVPAFSSSIHDYYVPCAAGANHLTVSMTAAEGSLAALTEPTKSSSRAEQSIAVSVVENQAVVVTATRGSSSAAYWVRCLPHDFPRVTVAAHPSAGEPPPGYYLLGDVSPATSEGSFGMVLDVHGVPVWYARTIQTGGVADVEMLAPESISFSPNIGLTYGSANGSFELHDIKQGSAVLVTPVAEPLSLHELRVLSNGDHLLLTTPIKTGVDLTGLSTYGPSSNMVDCGIQELDPNGKEVWSWRASEHFDPVKDCTDPIAKDVEGKTTIDVFHCNSIDVSSDGDLLLSARFMDSIFLISKATGKLIWKMGGASYTRDGAPFIAVTNDPLGGFFRQHDARFQADGEISLYDDRSDVAGNSRALVLSYDVAAGTAHIVWQYTATSHSSAMGSFRILSDGSRVVGFGAGSLDAIALTEVDFAGNDLLDMWFADGDESYRAIKVAAGELNLDDMHASVSAEAVLNEVSTDAGSRDAGGDGGANAVACHAMSGAGSASTCTSTSSTAPGFTCSDVPGSVAGSCPSADLYGCCVEHAAGDGGATILTATCYYAADAGQAADSVCSEEAYDGEPYNWQTVVP